eukprot:8368488-Pyramimonas_sp.AAC.1
MPARPRRAPPPARRPSPPAAGRRCRLRWPRPAAPAGAGGHEGQRCSGWDMDQKTNGTTPPTAPRA